MEFQLLSQAALLIATAIAAYTDWKTGMIFDWLTFPLIGLGILLRIVQADWIGLGIGTGTFALLYALYWTGKIGGGDVKLFTGIALVLPQFNGQVFLLNVVFFAALSAMTFYSIYYLVKIRKNKIRVSWNENKSKITLAVAFGLFTLLLLGLLIQQNGLSIWSAGVIAIPFLLSAGFVAVENTVKKHFFLQHIPLSELEEDEIIATEFMDEKTMSQSGLNLKKIIGENEKKQLRELGISKVPVYRNAPKFGPFIFLGVLLGIFWPGFFTTLFLTV